MSDVEKMHFITSSGIKNIVGKDLITDRFVAIFELVKNSYDARASKVIVSFESLGGAPNIIVRDNGIGMSKSDLEDKWLHLAYSEKEEGHSNESRAFVGSKGVGRFSCDSLGKSLTIKSKKSGELEEHVLKVNWEDFEKSKKIKFEDVEVEYLSNKLSIDKIDTHYTELCIADLRHIWNEDAVTKTVESLRRLKNPFLDFDGFDIYCGLDLISIYEVVAGIEFPKESLVKSNISEVLKNKSITIETKVGNKIEVSLFDRGQHIYTLEKNNDTSLVDIEIFITINYLTTSAKSTFTRRMGVEPVNYGNIFIYKNNFRVSPYGDADYDLFGVNVRKSQGYYRHLGTREILGCIDIKDLNSRFMETSSRNSGFIENAYLEALKDLYFDYAHKLLERYIGVIEWGEIKETGREVFFESVQKNEVERFAKSLTSKVNGDFYIKYFSDSFELEEKSQKKVLQIIASKLPAKEKKQVEKIIKNVARLEEENVVKEQELDVKQEVIETLLRQNKNLSVKRAESSYAEQLGHHLPGMADRLCGAVDDLNALASIIPTAQSNLYLKALSKIRRTELELRSFKELLLRTEIDLRSPQGINWFDLAVWFKDDKLQNNHGAINVVCVMNDLDFYSKWLVRSNAVEVVMMFENFYQNALDHNAKFVEFLFDEDCLKISSDSKAINPDILDKIFELGFSSKKNGTGIGLNQVRSFLTRINFEVKASNSAGLVLFTISRCEN
ncbi:ATP-binding protein [Iodobacter sp. CM08]|uniref:ATP-binding protein n=1 Tax=Iodobacter sp. CM08 TaxID=3085902 RepID=UPI002981344C|nr:ATP-binding protein [Iodobacter sp. CM08]MDW5415033.1 ATP-binding protein [Iodobacter sp. CM08]